MSLYGEQPGASDAQTVDSSAHSALDRALPRAGHRRSYAPFEGPIVQVRDPGRRAIVPTPDPSILDPIVAAPGRAARFPVAFTVRRGAFTDQPFRGNRAALQRAAAAAAPQQQMEASPTVRRNTFRVTPVPWDETMNEGKTG